MSESTTYVALILAAFIMFVIANIGIWLATITGIKYMVIVPFILSTIPPLFYFRRDFEKIRKS